MSGVLVVIEQRDGAIGRIGWEALAAGQWLGTNLGLAIDAAILGADTSPAAAQIAAKAVAKVARVEHPLLAQ